MVGEVYGRDCSVRRLSSERDETFLLTGAGGQNLVLKIANPAEDPAALEFQDGALLHLEAVAPSVPVQRLIRTNNGELRHILATVNGPRIMRLLSFLPGELQHRTPASPAQSRSIGRSLAHLGLGLKDYNGRPPAGKLMWDISHTLDLSTFIHNVAPERRSQAAAVLAEFENAQEKFGNLERRQIIHNDFNPHNVLLDPTTPTEVVGIIDFGDMVRGPLINDLAVALSYQLETDDWCSHLRALIEGFQAIRPLMQDEIELLPTLTRCRLAMTIIITEWRSAMFPDNRSYIMRNHTSAWRGLQNISDLKSAGLKQLVPELYEA